jgi:hypothetical protein
MPELVSLSTIYPFWKISYIPSAVESVRRGIDKERERFHGKPFVVVATSYYVDYSNSGIRIQLIDGFSTEDEAVSCALKNAEDAVKRTKAIKAYDTYEWEVVYWPCMISMTEREDSEHVQRRFYEIISLTCDSGYDYKQFVFEVLYVDAAETIGPELLMYLGESHELFSFFGDQGCAQSTVTDQPPEIAVPDQNVQTVSPDQRLKDGWFARLFRSLWGKY